MNTRDCGFFVTRLLQFVQRIDSSFITTSYKSRMLVTVESGEETSLHRRVTSWLGDSLDGECEQPCMCTNHSRYLTRSNFISPDPCTNAPAPSSPTSSDRALQDELRPLYASFLLAAALWSANDVSTVQDTVIGIMDLSSPEQGPNIGELLRHLGSRDDPVRKMAAFKLQSLTNDPSFAEVFVQRGGLPKLRLLVLESSGNTLAYGLASFARLLDVDQGWEAVDDAVVEKVRAFESAQRLLTDRTAGR
jgi:hypothetical protein